MATPRPEPADADLMSYELSSSEAEEISRLLKSLSQKYAIATQVDVLDQAADIARSLPQTLVRFLSSFRLGELAGAALIRGFRVSQAVIGPTPPHPLSGVSERTVEPDLFLILLASLLGDVFGWRTLQDGAILHNVLPIPGDEYEQSGAGSKVELDWHIEDAFHECRADYLALMCLRNPSNVPTSLASLRSVDLDSIDLQLLRERRFQIRPDRIHIRGAKTPAERTFAGQSGIIAHQSSPEPTSILFGAADSPYLRINPPFMQPSDGDTRAVEALASIIERLTAVLHPVPLQPGDVLVVDNYLSVHGRGAFQPFYDGNDRWLRKVLITRDLRKSRHLRRTPASRVLE